MNWIPAFAGMSGRDLRLDQHLLARGYLAAAVVRQHEVRNARRDLGTEARAVEHAVVPDAVLEVVHFVFVGNVRAQALRGFRLPDTRDIVELALDSEQRDAADLRKVDRLAAGGP